MDRILGLIFMRIFIWSGAKIFDHIALYVPEGEEGEVLCMVFSTSEVSLINAYKAALQDTDEFYSMVP